MRSAALIAFVAGLIAVVVFEVVPWTGRERDFPALIPNPPPLQTQALDLVEGGHKLCMKGLAIDPHARQARFVVGTYHRPGPPMELTITAPGYRAVARQPAGFADNATLSLAIPAPPRASLVTACIANRGRHKVALYAADDQARSRTSVFMDGSRVIATPTFGFWEGRPATLADRAGVTADRIATFRGFLGHAWIVWLLLALFCFGIPLALGFALWRGVPR